MKKLIFTTIALLLMSCGGSEAQAQDQNEETMSQKLYLAIGDQTITATLVTNEATMALVEALTNASITYEANDYGGFEKVGSLGRSLPTNNSQITTQPGDIVLYNGNQIVLFYGSNTWSYTHLGHIDCDSLDQLKNFLCAGQGRVNVTLSVGNTSGIRSVSIDKETNEYIGLDGIRTNHPSGGIYIYKGKKILR